jgi:hypothetical protein
MAAPRPQRSPSLEIKECYIECPEPGVFRPVREIDHLNKVTLGPDMSALRQVSGHKRLPSTFKNLARSPALIRIIVNQFPVY